MAGAVTGPDHTTLDRRKKLLLKVWTHHKASISRVLYACGILAFLALPLGGKGGYADEKSLLLGLTSATFRPTAAPAIAAIVPQLLTIDTSLHERLPRLVHAAARLAGASIQWHNTSTCPISSAVAVLKPGDCNTMHSIARAGRGDGTEGLAFLFPVNLLDPQAAALAVAVAVLSHTHLQRAPWLAKDVAVVLLDVTHRDVEDGVQSWLNAYNDPGQLLTFPRAGALQQAVVVDVQCVGCGAATISVHGAAGRLPNYDMYWLLRKNLEYYTSLPVAIRPSGGAAARRETDAQDAGVPAWRQHVKQVQTAVAQALQAASGRASGAHALFLDRGIDAGTVTFTAANGARGTRAGRALKNSELEQSGGDIISFVEAVARSANNLQERLHHANALYLLLSPEGFVGVGVYVVAPACLLLAALVQAVHALEKTTGATQREWRSGWATACAVHAMLAGMVLLARHSMAEPTIPSQLAVPSLCVVAICSSVPSFLAGCSVVNSAGESEANSTGAGCAVAAFLSVLLVEGTALLLSHWALCYIALLTVLPLTHKICFA